jgi:translation initiation factor IF-1
VIAAPPPVALTAAPAHVALAGAAVQAITVANPGKRVAVVEARLAGFALDLHGRPRVVVRRDRSVVLSVAPQRLALAPGATGTVLVASTIRRGAGAGDHVGLILLTTQPRGSAGVGVRMQIGVPVTIRVPGAVRRRVVFEGMRLAKDVLELRFHNTGNVMATIGARRFRIELRRGGRVLATLHVRRRELLPGARSVVDVHLPQRIPGRMRAVVEADDGGGGLLRRALSVSRRPRDR